MELANNIIFILGMVVIILCGMFFWKSAFNEITNIERQTVLQRKAIIYIITTTVILIVMYIVNGEPTIFKYLTSFK